MRRQFLCALALAGFGPGAWAGEPGGGACRADRRPEEGLPAHVKAWIGKAQDVAPCRVASLPEPVRAALAGRAPRLDMADPGQKWASGDVVFGDLPRRQLVRAARTADVWVIDYRRGGFAVTYNVAVISVDGDEGHILWSGRCQGGRGKGKWRCTEARR